MEFRRALTETLKNRRFWLWQIAGVIIYGIPVAYRFATKSVEIPILNFPGQWIDHYIPGNMLEKILVNAFFPGGAGGVAGEVLATKYRGVAIRGKSKYLARLGGALFQTTVWSAFQYWGYSLMILGPWSIGGQWGNIFEHWTVFPFNFALSALSIFTPDVLYSAKSALVKAHEKLSRRSSKG
jgi:hypothetical protein